MQMTCCTFLSIWFHCLSLPILTVSSSDQLSIAFKRRRSCAVSTGVAEVVWFRAWRFPPGPWARGWRRGRGLSSPLRSEFQFKCIREIVPCGGGRALAFVNPVVSADVSVDWQSWFRAMVFYASARSCCEKTERVGRFSDSSGHFQNKSIFSRWLFFSIFRDRTFSSFRRIFANFAGGQSYKGVGLIVVVTLLWRNHQLRPLKATKPQKVAKRRIVHGVAGRLGILLWLS